MTGRRKSYVQFMRVMAWNAVVCGSAFVVMCTYGKPEVWGI